MKRLSSTLFFLYILAFCIHAQPFDLDTAKEVALHFLQDKGSPETTMEDLQLLYLSQETEANRLAYYKNARGGYLGLCVSGSDYLVISWSLKGDFRINENNISFQALRQFYEQVDPGLVKTSLALGAKQLKGATALPDQIDPLLDAEGINWNQDYPYNEACPYDPVTDSRSLAGCVAVAMGQIMRYHQHPVQGSGSNSYVHPEYGELSADFGSTTYRWDLMPGSISSSQPDIAQLLFHAGVSVNMNYSPAGSSAYSEQAITAFKEYFNYPSAMGMDGSPFTGDDYFTTLRTELAESRPVYLSLRPGTIHSDGHAVVCDGYDGNYFHLNFGWGGNDNGYYLLEGVQFFGQNALSMNPMVILGLSPSYIPCREQDSLALVSIYQATGGTQWKHQSGWLSENVSEWEGVTILNGRVRFLHLQDFGLNGDLPPETGDLSALYRLSLGSNELRSIPEEIGQLKELIEFSAGQNQLSQFPEGLFNCSSLKFINLFDNQISSIPPSGFEKMSALERLDLSYNQISGSLPASIWQSGALRDIDISHNQISSLEEIPETISELPLKYLTASVNRIASIPSSLGRLDSLELLFMDQNQLSGPLPASFGNLSKLRELHLQNNQLSLLPPEMGAMDSLRVLKLSDNQISTLPAELFQAGMLEEIEVRRNRLNGKSIPPEMGGLNHLRILDLAVNEIQSLPEEWGNLYALERCYLDSNRIARLPETIGGLKELIVLGVSHNELEEIPVNINQLAGMVAIDFSYNKLRSVSPGLSYMPQLRHMELSHNLIDQDLPPLKHLEDLNMLSLNYNKLNFQNLSTSGITLGAFSGSFFVSYQDSVEVAERYFQVEEGEALDIDIRKISSLEHPENQYIWYREGEVQHHSEGPILSLSAIDGASAGAYYCKVENNQVHYNLNLFSQMIRIGLAEEQAEQIDTLVTSSLDPFSLAVDTLHLIRDPELRGKISWQASTDSLSWFSLEESITEGIISSATEEEDQVIVIPKTVAAFRYQIEEENCETVYSDTIAVCPLIHLLDTLIDASSEEISLQKGELQIIIPAGFHPEPFRLTADQMELAPMLPDTIRKGILYDINVSFGSKFTLPLNISIDLDGELLQDIEEKAHIFKAVYFDEEKNQWVPFETASMSLRDTAVLIQTDHLTRLGWWEVITTGGYNRYFEKNNVTVYYNPLPVNFDAYYTWKQGAKPWHVGELNIHYGTPTYIQDICWYTYQTRQKLKDDGLPVPEKFTVYVKDQPTYGVVGVMALLNGYVSIDNDIQPEEMDIRSVVAHEYWHYTQDEYIVMLNKGNIFWTEATAHLTDWLVWDESDIPVSESMKILNDNLSGKHNIFYSLAWAWDAYDYSAIGETFVGDVNYCYQAGVFLHYMRSYRSGSKLDPVKLLKNTSYSGSWKSYLDAFIKANLESDIGSEYGNFVRYLMEGSNEKFTLFAPDEHEKSNPLRYLQGAPPDFIQKKFVTSMKPNTEAGILKDSVEFSLPHLSAQMFELNNLVKDSLMFVKFIRSHEPEDDLKVYLCNYDKDRNGFELHEISSTEESYLSLLPQSKDPESKYEHQAYLLLINESADKAIEAKFLYEIRGVIPITRIDCGFRSSDGSIPTVGGELSIHHYSDSEVRPWNIYAVQLNSSVSIDPGSAEIHTSGSNEELGINLDIVQNVLENTIHIQYSRTSSYYIFYDPVLGSSCDGTTTESKSMVLKNMPPFSPAPGAYLKYYSATANTAETQQVIQSMDHSYRDEIHAHEGGSRVEEYSYSHTDYSLSDQISFVIQME